MNRDSWTGDSHGPVRLPGAGSLDALARQVARQGVCAVLIGGTSHVGKSSAAAVVADVLRCTVRPTDTIARHPGRPWPTDRGPVPPHVAEHYRNLPQPALIADVIRHYANVWGTVRRLVAECSAAGSSIVLEGSAIMPAFAVELRSPAVRACWVTAPDGVVEARIRAGSRYSELDRAARALVEVFIERSLRFNARVLAEAEAANAAVIALRGDEAIDEVAAECLHVLAAG